jgi:type IX secretion system PorP/SprF family membrane protein
MKKYLKEFLLTLIIVTMSYLSYSQDFQFSQFYAAPLYLNPAFAGTDSSARFGFNYRDQWPSMPGTYIDYNLAYDQYVNALHGGFGVSVWKEDEGSGTYKTTNISGGYSCQINVTNDFTINAGIQGSYMQNSIDYSKITYGDMINNYGLVFTQNLQLQYKSSINYLDLSAGVLGYTNEFYGGVTLSHLNQPDISYTDVKFPMPMKITADLGAMIPIDNSKKTLLSPNVICILQQSFQQYNLGLDMQHGLFTGGLWYRFSPTNGDAMVGMLGIKYKRLKVAYSYDITISGLANYSGGAHEISLGFLFNSKKNNTTSRRINCPAF